MTFFISQWFVDSQMPRITSTRGDTVHCFLVGNVSTMFSEVQAPMDILFACHLVFTVNAYDVKFRFIT